MKPLVTLLALLFVTPAVAQELSVETALPLEGDLLIHSGSFRAQRSLVESVGCPRGQPRERRQQIADVKFDPPFREPPQVLVALNMMDFGVYDDTYREVRVRARADDVSRHGMLLVVETWCDTNMYGAGGTYFVMGERGEESDIFDPVPLEVEPADPPDPEDEVFLDYLEEW